MQQRRSALAARLMVLSVVVCCASGLPNISPGSPLLVLYGSQTGTAEDIALGLCRCAAALQLTPRCVPMDAYEVCNLAEEHLVVCIASTTGDGEAPMTMRRFWATLRRRDLPVGALANLHYAVFGCGDTSYPKFNAVARRLDLRLQQLGATQLVPCGLGDDQAPAGVDSALCDWLPTLLHALCTARSGKGAITLGLEKRVLPLAFYGGSGAARMNVSFRTPPVLSRSKENIAMRALASADRLVLFTNGNLESRRLCRGSWAAIRLMRSANLSYSYWDASLDPTLSLALPPDVRQRDNLGGMDHGESSIGATADNDGCCEEGGEKWVHESSRAISPPCICVAGHVVVSGRELLELAEYADEPRDLDLDDQSRPDGHHAPATDSAAGVEETILGRLRAALNTTGRCEKLSMVCGAAAPNVSSVCAAKGHASPSPVRSCAAPAVVETALHESIPAGALGESRAHHFWHPVALLGRSGMAHEGNRSGGVSVAMGAGSEGPQAAPGLRGAIFAQVESVSRMTDTVHWPDVRDVRHIVLRVPETVKYHAGDVALVYARNRPIVTNRFLRLVGLDGDARVESIQSTSSHEFPVHNLNIRPPCALRELISAHPDLERPPRASTLRGLALLASNGDQRQRLEEIAHSPADFQDYVETSRRPLISVLEDFPSVCQADVGSLLSVIPRLQPRPYSIASSPSAHRGLLHLCVAMVRISSARLSVRGVRRGICSSFLASLEPGSSVPVCVPNGAKACGAGGGLTFDYTKPAVLVGPGTGIAPLRSFLHERQLRLRRRGSTLGPVVAFLGFRHRFGDALYHLEWHAMQAAGQEGDNDCRTGEAKAQYEDGRGAHEASNGDLEQGRIEAAGENAAWRDQVKQDEAVVVHVAYSRDGSRGGGPAAERKNYVQEHIMKEGKGLWKLLGGPEVGHEGIVYVAGSAGAMPAAVAHALCHVAEVLLPFCCT